MLENLVITEVKNEEGKWSKKGKPLYAMSRLFEVVETIVPQYTIQGGCPKNSKEISTIVDFIVETLSADERINFTISPRSVFDTVKLAFNWYPKSPMNKCFKKDQEAYRKLYYAYRLSKL